MNYPYRHRFIGNLLLIFTLSSTVLLLKNISLVASSGTQSSIVVPSVASVQNSLPPQDTLLTRNLDCPLAWTVVPGPDLGPTQDYLQGVAVLAADDVWAVGTHDLTMTGPALTLVEHWDGAEWSMVPSPNVVTGTNNSNILIGVEAVSPNDAWSVGYAYGPGSPSQRSLIEHWDGMQWSVMPSPVLTTVNLLRSIAATSSNDVWAVGYRIEANGSAGYMQTLTMHWDGSQWNEVPSPNVGPDLRNNELGDVEAIAPDDVWAVGYYSTSPVDHTLVLHWDGTAWSIVPTPSSSVVHSNLRSVSAASPNDVWAVGDGPITIHWNGTEWDSVPNPVPSGYGFLRGISAHATDDVWAVGYQIINSSDTLVMHWDGHQWSLVPSPNPAPLANILDGVEAVSADDVWAVGESVVNGGRSKVLIERYTDPCVTPTPTPSATVTPSATPATPLPTATPCASQFNDVPPESPFYTYIRCLACRGIISGYADGTFLPGNDLTRGQIAKMVSNAAAINDDPGPQLYQDVASDNPFYTWVNRLSNRGYMGGYPCDEEDGEPCVPPDNLPYFRSFNNATRGQLSKIVSNAAGLGGDPKGQFYADVPTGHPFYLWIMRLTQLGVMSGYECGGEGEPCDSENRPYFRPGSNVTRGQASKIVANTFFPDCYTPARP